MKTKRLLRSVLDVSYIFKCKEKWSKRIKRFTLLLWRVSRYDNQYISVEKQLQNMHHTTAVPTYDLVTFIKNWPFVAINIKEVLWEYGYH